MPKKRKSIPVKPVINNREEAEAVLGEIAALKIEANGHKQKIDEATAAAAAIHDAPIAAALAQIDVKTDQLEAWAIANPEAFAGKKTLEMIRGTISFRKGNPSVKQVRGVSVESTLELLDKDGGEYVRTTTEIDKEGILKAYADALLDDEELAAYGLKIVQSEKFHVDPKLETNNA